MKKLIILLLLPIWSFAQVSDATLKSSADSVNNSAYNARRAGNLFLNLIKSKPTNLTPQTSGTNTYTVSLAPNITSYITGLTFDAYTTIANTSTATLNVNSLGAKNIKKLVTGSVTSLSAGDLPIGKHSFYYDGTQFIVSVTSSGGGGGITNSAANTELGMSDGTNIVSSKLFSTTVSTNQFLTIGSASITGNKIIQAVNTAGNAQLNLTGQGGTFIDGNHVSLGGDITTNGTVTILNGSSTSVTFPSSGTLLNNALTSAHILVGNVSGVATDIAVTGDIGLSSSAVATLVNTAVTPGSYTSSNITVDSKGRITAASNGSGGSGEAALTIVTKSSNYTAAVTEFVNGDVTSASFNVTLPSAPTDKTRCGVKLVTPTASLGGHTISFICGGTDVFNRPSGSTTLTLSRQDQTYLVQYTSATGVWTVISTDPALGSYLNSLANGSTPGSSDKIIGVQGGTPVYWNPTQFAGYNTVDAAGTPLTQRAVIDVYNGLTSADNVTKTDVVLGGPLTSNTTINGAFSLIIGTTGASALNVNGTRTATANNETSINLSPSATLRATASDAYYLTTIGGVATSGAATQNMGTLLVNGTFVDSNSAKQWIARMQNAGTDAWSLQSNGKVINTSTYGSSATLSSSSSGISDIITSAILYGANGDKSAQIYISPVYNVNSKSGTVAYGVFYDASSSGGTLANNYAFFATFGDIVLNSGTINTTAPQAATFNGNVTITESVAADVQLKVINTSTTRGSGIQIDGSGSNEIVQTPSSYTPNGLLLANAMIFVEAGAGGIVYDNSGTGDHVFSNGGFATTNESLRIKNKGVTIHTQQVMTSAWLPMMTFTPGAHTGMTASTEFNHILNSGATWTWGSGTITTQRFNYDKAFTIAGTSGTNTVTNAYARYIEAPVVGSNAAITNNYALGLAGNLSLTTAGNYIAIKEGSGGFMGVTTLVSGTKAITIAGLTSSDRAFPGFVSQGGTSTGVFQYSMVCSTNTLTITAVTVGNTTVTTDTSTINYIIFRPTP